MNAFSVPGGFGIRFTGMRVISADGTSIQGRGIVPDEIVHPTLEGVHSGRDEILEAGIAAAQRLAQQSTVRGRAP
jgi:C-terminal processing protease CtpA/Prc